LIEPLDIQPSILRFIFAVARTKNPRSSTALMNLVCLYFFHSSCTAQMGEARQVASSPPGPARPLTSGHNGQNLSKKAVLEHHRVSAV
jgi:hypothetical protein